MDRREFMAAAVGTAFVASSIPAKAEGALTGVPIDIQQGLVTLTETGAGEAEGLKDKVFEINDPGLSGKNVSAFAGSAGLILRFNVGKGKLGGLPFARVDLINVPWSMLKSPGNIAAIKSITLKVTEHRIPDTGSNNFVTAKYVSSR